MSLHWNGQRREPFLTVMFYSLWEATSHESVYQQQLLRREESRSGESNHTSSSYQPNALPLGHTGSCTYSPATGSCASLFRCCGSFIFSFVVVLILFCLFFVLFFALFLFVFRIALIYNRNGWLGVKHQLIYLFFTELFTQSIWRVSWSVTPTFCLWFDGLRFTLKGHLKKKKKCTKTWIL